MRMGCLKAVISYPTIFPCVSWRVTRVLFIQEEDEFEQHELLQKRREDRVKEKGKKALELRSPVEQRQVEQVKERYYPVSILEKGT